MIQYIDAHCHILSDAQMRDAVSHGVGRFIVNATRPSDWGAVLKLACRDDVCGAIGVHPWYVSELNDGWDVQLVDTLATYPNLMVGEIGLDKNHPNMGLQISVFRRQLGIAHNMGRVAYIHCVGAWGKMMNILRGAELPPAMVFHGFSGAPDLVQELVKIGAYFSFGAGVANARRAKMRAAVAVVPVSRILVESDAPDCAMPNSVPNTVAEIAQLCGEKDAKMAKIIYDNTMGIINGGQI